MLRPSGHGRRGPGDAGERMIAGKRVCVVMPAYNAAKTIRQTVAEIDRTIADDLIVVDDKSQDDTARVAHDLPVHVIEPVRNRWQGGNQETCYAAALPRGPDVIV